MTTQATAPKTSREAPMAWLARKIAYARDAEGMTTLALAGRAIAVGDPVTDSAANVDVGVDSCSVWLDSLSQYDDDPVLVARLRTTLAVRWEQRPTGGVDAGVFGLWDAGAAQTTDDVDGANGACGVCDINGRRVFAIETGDGHFACVVGLDAAGEIAALVAGPGVRTKRFGAGVREEDISPEERAEAERERAVQAKLASADVLSALLGEGNACPVTRVFVAGIVQDAGDDVRQALATAVEPHLPALTVPSAERKAKAQAKARVGVLIAWGLERWAKLLAVTMSAEAEALLAFQVDAKGKIDPPEAIGRIHDYKTSDRKFDLAWAFGGPALVAEALKDMPSADDPRLGLAGLLAVSTQLKLKEPEKAALWYARDGLLRALELHILKVRAADVDGGALRPRSRAYVDALIATLDAPSSAIARLAAR